MEKILLAIDATEPDATAFNFAAYLAKLTGSSLTGVFLENFVADDKAVFKRRYGFTYVEWEPDQASQEFRYKRELIEKNIAHFKEFCHEANLEYCIHRDRGVPANELTEESRFADVLIIDPTTSFEKKYAGMPSELVSDVLQRSACPVIIAPATFESIDEIIFAYNGSTSSLFAIKQFTYLFPELREKKVTIMQVNTLGIWTGTEKYKLKEWLKNHYTNLNFEVLKGSPEGAIMEQLMDRKNIFIVMGAYGRNAFSQFLRRSHATPIIRNLNQPLFIAHI